MYEKKYNRVMERYELFDDKHALYQLLEEGRKAATEGRKRPYKDAFNDIKQGLADGKI